MEDLNESDNGSDENEESDSGDSLFITQKPIPHPVRSTTSPHLSHRSTPFSATVESSSESETVDPKTRKKPICLPKYNFPFLKKRKLQAPEDGLLFTGQNRAIHYHGIAGFFKCVRKMWPSKNGSIESALPSIDSENEEITPITEDEKSDEEDVQVIGKRLLVYSLQPTITKSSQPWFRSLKNKMSQNEALSQENFGIKKKSRKRSNKAKKNSNKQQKHPESRDSDATFIEDYEFATSSKNTNNYTSESTMNQSNTNQENELSAVEEYDYSESQSILQYNALDMRGSSQHSVCIENSLHQSTKKKCKNNMMEGDGEHQDRSLSQESLQLFDKPNAHKNKTSSKNDMNLFKKKNKDDAEKLHDGECELESTQVFMSSNTVREVNGLEDPVSPSYSNVHLNNTNNATVCKRHKNKTDLENTEKETNSLNVDPLQMLEIAQMGNITSVEKEASDMSNGKRKERHRKRKADPGDCNNEQDIALKTLQLINMDKNVLSKCVESRGKLVDNTVTDCTTTQSDEPVSVKKKKNVSSAAETVKNANLHLSQSTPGHGAEELGISTNNVELTETSSHNNKTSRKSNNNHFPTRRDGAEHQHDGDSGFPEYMAVSCSTDKEENGQRIHEDTGLPSCTNVEDLNNDFATVPKKKKKHKKKNANLENSGNRTNILNIDPLQMPDNRQTDHITAVDTEVSEMSERKKSKKKQRVDSSDCNAEQDTALKVPPNETDKNGLSKLDESQEKSEHIKYGNITTNCITTQSDEPVSVKKKKRKLSSAAETVENANVPFSQSTPGHGADELHISTNNVELTETCSTEKEVNGQRIYEDTELPSCTNVEDLNNDFATVPKKKKHKKHKKKNTDLENSENETNILNIDPLQMPDNRQADTAVDIEMLEMSDGKRKKPKKKRRVDSDDYNDEQDTALKVPQNKTDKNGSTKLDESQEKSKHGNIAIDCIVTQSDEPVSVKKKKRKLSSAAETVEKANLPFSQSTPSHGADELHISTNSPESAETNRLLQETELGKKIKKMKKKRRKDDDLDNLGANDNASEGTEMSRSNESNDCGSAEVAQPLSADDDHVKKKKKSKQKSHQPDHKMTFQRQTSEVEESAILSPNASERKKKKKYIDKSEGVIVETAVVAEQEQNTEKGEKIKKKKNKIKNSDQISGVLSHGEMSTSSGSLETSSRTKVKKRLYNPNSENWLENV